MRSRVGSSRPLVCCAGALVLALGLGGSVRAAGTLRAGAATSNVSPWLGLSVNGGMTDRKVQHVHDELHARALVLDDGKTRVAIVVCDSCATPRDVVTEAKRRIVAQSKIAADHVLISATHAHTCPTATAVFQSDPDPEYQRFYAVRIADAVQQAVNNLAPAAVGWGVGRNDRQVHNRRWRMKPGTIPADPFGRTDDRARMNPTPGSPDLIEPAGPIDPEISIVSVRAADGRPIALLANYSLHYVGDTGPGHVSADYFGAFADCVQRRLKADRLDPPFVAMMSNGTSGDINNINFRTPAVGPKPPYTKIRAVADELAQEAVRVASAISYRDDLTLDAKAEDISLGVRLPGAEDLARAEAIVAKAKGPEMKTVAEMYARETVLLARYPKQVDVTIQALRIGELGVVAIPCEVFVEIGLGLKARSPLKPTFTIELANGYNGYLPTKEQHALGGYETWRARSSYLEVDAASKITATALKLLEAVSAR